MPKYFFELIERERPIALTTICVAKVCPCSDPGAWVGVELLRDGEGVAKELDGLREVVEVVEHDSEFVEEEGVGLAELVRGVEVFLG